MVIIQYILAVVSGRSGKRIWHYSFLKGGDRLSLVHREMLLGDYVEVRRQSRVEDGRDGLEVVI